MSVPEKNTAAHLDFFKSAILKPTLGDSYLPRVFWEGKEEESITRNFEAIEAVHWARMGVQIGYLAAEETKELISSSHAVFRAWSDLRRREAISLEDDWAKIIRIGPNENPVLNDQLFSMSLEIDSEWRELVQHTFQMFLLLNNEHLLDNAPRYFLDCIGWTSDEEWLARSKGRSLGQRGSVQDITSGFADVWSYWEEMQSSSNYMIPQGLSQIYQGVSDEAQVLVERLAVLRPIWRFLQDARTILSRRFNLGQINVVERYFVLAGEFVNRAREDTSEWLDTRLRVFNVLTGLIISAGGDIRRHTHELWNLFTTSTGESLNIDVTSPWEARPIRKPEELL